MMRRQKLFLIGLLSPVTLYLGLFFFGPLVIIGVFSFLEPGLYGGVEWNFYHWNYGRMFGWADGVIEWYEPIYLTILFRSMFLPVYASVERLDRAMIEASGDLGARGWQTFLKVIFPQTMPGIAGGSVLVFIPSVGNFIIPDVLGGAKGLMIGNLVEQQFLDARNWPFGAALSMVIMAVVLTVMLVYAKKIVRAGEQVGEV